MIKHRLHAWSKSMIWQRRFCGKAQQIISNYTFVNICKRMSTNGTTHLERTAAVKRSKVVSAATVVKIQNVSSTVKLLKLQIKDNEFSFLAGQWVDFVIPDLQIVGGYSMCSSPKYLTESGMLDLAVKNSSHPPAHWVHNKCKIGDIVLLKVGGNCTWNPAEPSKQKNTLLVAGGIGINPLLSILIDIVENRHLSPTNSSNIGKCLLLYSAGTKDELIFKDKLDSLTSETEHLRCKYFITKDGSHDSPSITGKRIEKDDITQALQELASDKGVQCFVCGPPPMIKNMLTYLAEGGVDKPDIHYEQWW